MTATLVVMTTPLLSPRPDHVGAHRLARAAGCLALATAVLAACAPPDLVTQDVTAPGRVTGDAAAFSYVGPVQQVYLVPDGVNSLTVVARGGEGGVANNTLKGDNGGRGAEVTGTVAVQPGQTLLIWVAGKGGSAGKTKDDPQGGWGALGAGGGNGNAAKDYLRTSGAGGGATTVQLVGSSGDPVTLLVAGGGGGAGAPSGDTAEAGDGGSGGCASPDDFSPSWTGSDGERGSSSVLKGGGGGAAGSEAAPAGARGKGGSGLGGNGGGGGGGVAGGGPGGGASLTSAGGGGGAGSSTAVAMSATSVTCSEDRGDGAVTVTVNR